MFNNPYMNSYNPQMTIDKINEQMNELNRMKQQLQQPQQPSINQTFQLSPTSNNNIKYVNNIDDVNKELVFNDTPFFTKDLSQMWLKNSKGEIRFFELNEVIKKDDKDLLIASLQMQIEDLRKEMRNNAKSNDEYVTSTNQDEKPSNVSNVRTGKKK
jgi:hypothetical protein